MPLVDVVKCKVLKHPKILYCTKCEKELYKSTTIYISSSSKCDCDWKCCEFSKAGAQRHGQHLAYKDE